MKEPTALPLETWARRIAGYGAICVTIFIFLLFLFGMVVTARNHDAATFNGLLETVKALAMVAAGYWIGSSNSSAKKDDMIANSNAKKDDTIANSSAKKDDTIAANSVALATSIPVSSVDLKTEKPE